MTGYQFTLIVEGPDLQEAAHLGALFRMGCSDATVGRRREVQYLDFDRQAETFPEAVSEAMAAIEAAVPGARVVRLEPDDLVTMADIAARTGRTREGVRLLALGERGPGGFPAPATHFRSRYRMWRWPAVLVWFGEALGEASSRGDLSRHQFVAAFNAALDLRRHQEGLSPADRRRLRRLVS
ncbi:MAG TPA: hypothetical protein VMX37_00535 [Acidimicrobiia bacterium]|nr:hypothetical protein [Acidimicrobiia bacterium]